MKKLQSLMSTKFEPLSADAMRFIVGGEACATGGGQTPLKADGTVIKYSADTRESSTVITYNTTTDKSTATTSCEPVTGGVTK